MECLIPLPLIRTLENWDVSNASVPWLGCFGWLQPNLIKILALGMCLMLLKNMADMFRSSYDGTNYESSFNQDLSSWNVDNVVSSENFSLDASNWTEPKPNFSQLTFRTDAYSSFLKLAIPGSAFTGLITDGFDDVHADIVGSGTNIQYELTGSAP